MQNEINQVYHVDGLLKHEQNRAFAGPRRPTDGRAEWTSTNDGQDRWLCVAGVQTRLLLECKKTTVSSAQHIVACFVSHVTAHLQANTPPTCRPPLLSGMKRIFWWYFYLSPDSHFMPYGWVRLVCMSSGLLVTILDVVGPHLVWACLLVPVCLADHSPNESLMVNGDVHFSDEQSVTKPQAVSAHLRTDKEGCICGANMTRVQVMRIKRTPAGHRNCKPIRQRNSTKIEWLREAKNIFRLIDEDGDGWISTSQLKAFLLREGFGPAEIKVRLLRF
ncbi:unnamed protein product [Protopolystoma xenopodis]|uniref:EF-hand domain-containing protein n=1 Tax=Protopolystoma xenopodis TaxID=117903 RepID=A0A448XEU1_9PLAT|nr:unnamed protein product [Protopolystoma xenopodis]